MGVASGLLGDPCTLPSSSSEQNLPNLGLPCGDGATSSGVNLQWCSLPLPREGAPGLSCCSLEQEVQVLASASSTGNHITSGAAGSKKLEELYEFEKGAKPLGEGGFGIVFCARVRRDPCTKVAIKMMDKVRLRQIQAPKDMVQNEVELLRECIGRDNFVQMYDYIETTSKYCLVLEYLSNGTLEDAVMMQEGFFGEVQVRFVMQQILDALSFLHSRNICHRDIKPHNFMMASGPLFPPMVSTSPQQAVRAASADGTALANGIRSPQAVIPAPRAVSTDNWPVRASPQQDGGLMNSLAGGPGEQSMSRQQSPPLVLRVKLGDFGTACRIAPGKLVRNKVGTPAFMAPEMHLLPGRSPGYDHKVDVWAAGVVMVFLLSTQYPFMDSGGRLLRHKLILGDLPLWESSTVADLFVGFQEAVGMRRKRPSKLGRDLALHLLTPGRHNRATATSALKHQWFKRPVLQEGESEVAPGSNLLDWKDFEDGLAVVGRDLQWAMDMMTGSLGATVDDPLKTCVVCYNVGGGVGYICPQCHHAVCAQCLDQLPKAVCPYCRHEALDMPFTKKVARMLQAQRPSPSSDHASCVHPGLNPSIAEKPRPDGTNARAPGVVPV